MRRRTVLTGAALAGAVGLAGGAGGFEAARRAHIPEARSARPADGRRGPVDVGVVWRVDTDRREVALTFDDGPHPDWTPRVLDLLGRHRARATLFAIGEHVQAHPDLVRRAVGEGHEIGNHTWSHARLDQCTPRQVHDELHRAAEAIGAVAGEPPRLMRPPWGKVDPVGLLAAAEAGYQVVLWSDLIRGESPGPDLTRTLTHLSAGSIVLGHDGGSTPTTELMAAFDRLLRGLADDGYTFVTVSALAAGRRLPAPRSPAEPQVSQSVHLQTAPPR